MITRVYKLIVFLICLQISFSSFALSNGRQYARQMAEAASQNDDVHVSEIKNRIESLTKPTQGNRRAARQLNQQGLDLLNADDWQRALVAFQDAYKADPSDVEIANNLGFVHLKLGQLRQAEQFILYALSLAPTRTSAWYNLGQVYGGLGEVPLAAGAFANAYRFSGNPGKTLEVISRVAEHENEDATRKAAQRALEIYGLPLPPALMAPQEGTSVVAGRLPTETATAVQTDRTQVAAAPMPAALPAMVKTTAEREQVEEEPQAKQERPKAVSAPAIAANSFHTMALRDDDSVWIWGGGESGVLVDGTTRRRLIPGQVNRLPGVVAIAAGLGHTLALRDDGNVWTWGENGVGQLGDGMTRLISTSPGQVSGLSGVVAIAAGLGHSVALREDGSVWAWGSNVIHQLGDGTTIARSTPVQVSGLSGVVAIAGGYFHSVALRDDGTVWVWGENKNGQLGDGTTIVRSTPVQVSGLSGVVAIAAGSNHTLALREDGSVWAWGANWAGQLGDDTTRDRSTPVQVSGLPGVVAIAAGDAHTVAFREDGGVWTWGENKNGQLGDGTTHDRSTPVPVSGLPGVVAIAAGGIHTVALREDGSVWAWGKNNSGQVGDGTTITRSTPVQVVGQEGNGFLNLGTRQRKVDVTPHQVFDDFPNGGETESGTESLSYPSAAKQHQAEERRVEIEQRMQDALRLTARLTCDANGIRTFVIVCLHGSRDSASGRLRIRSNGSTVEYTEIDFARHMTVPVYEIALSKGSEIFIQTNGDNMMRLTLEVINGLGERVYQDQATRYGVIRARY